MGGGGRVGGGGGAVGFWGQGGCVRRIEVFEKIHPKNFGGGGQGGCEKKLGESGGGGVGSGGVGLGGPGWM